MRNKDTQQSAQMRTHVENCKSSGLTVVAYCQSVGIKPSVYYYWQKRLRVNVGGAAFTQLSTMPAVSASTTLHFPNGVYLAFQSDLNALMLKELICCM